MPPSVEIVIKTVFSMISVTGVVGNFLVCLVVLLNRSMRTPMNYLLVNLAISDMLLLIFFSPTFIFRGTYTHPTGTIGDILCAIVTGETMAWMGGYASAILLLAISVERYFAVAAPHSYGASFITRNLKILVSGCWCFTLVWNSVGFVWKRYDDNIAFCNMVWSVNTFKVYSMLCFFVLGVIPMTTMAVLYSRIIYILWFKEIVIQLNQESQRQRRKRATKMVLTVSLVYALSWFPELTVFMLFAYAPTSLRGDIAYPATVAMVSFNSAINPIIYSFHSNQFRRHITNMICCRLRKGDMTDADISGSGTRNRAISRAAELSNVDQQIK